MHLFHTLSLGLTTLSLANAQTLREALASRENLSTLLTLLDDRPDFAANLAALQGLTIFAPSDSAQDFSLDRYTDGFAQDFSQEIRYHILDGRLLTSEDVSSEERFYPSLLLQEGRIDPLDPNLNRTIGQGAYVSVVAANNTVAITGSGGSALVTEADIEYETGIIHIVDRLILPPAVVTQRLATLSPPLLEAVNATRMAGLLDGAGLTPFTLFVPNEEAFAAAEGLEDVSNDQLARIVEYHAVLGTVAFSYDLSDGQELRSEGPGGSALTVSIDDEENVSVNGAQVVQTSEFPSFLRDMY
jgi:uncharacterized surface protein with fasciclin (FAS1) repeats